MKQIIKRLKRIIEDLFSNDVHLSYLASKALCDLSDSEHIKELVTDLLEGLLDERLWVRINSTSTLGCILAHFDDECIVERLIKFYRSRNIKLKTEIIYALTNSKIESTIEIYKKALKSKNERLKIGAITGLGRLYNNNVAFKLLLKVLKDKSPKIRERAVIALRNFKNQKAVIELIIALYDKNPRVRKEVLKTLGVYNDNIVIDAISRALDDEDFLVKVTAIEVLAKINNKNVLLALIDALRSPDKTIKRIAKREFITKISNNSNVIDSQIIDKISELIQDEDTDNKLLAIEIFGYINDERIIKFLAKGIRDEDPLIRKESLKSLSRLSLNDQLSYIVIALIISALHDKNLQVRNFAVDILKHLESDLKTKSLVKILDYKDPWIRLAGIKAITNIEEPQITEILIQALKDENLNIRCFAAKSLAKIKNEKVVDALIGALNDDNLEVREQAAISLAEIHNEKAAKPLILALIRPEHYLRKDAFAKASASIETEILLNTITSILNSSKDKYVKTTLIEFLGMKKDQRFIELLLKMLEDDNIEVRMATLRSLVKIDKRQATEHVIKSLMNSKFYLHRDELLKLLKSLDQDTVVKKLLRALDDAQDYGKLMITYAFKYLTDKRTIDPLINLLQEDNIELRVLAAKTLAKFDEEKVIDALIEITLSPVNLTKLKELCEAIESLKYRKLVVSKLLKQINEKDKYKKRVIAELLGYLNNNNGLSALLELLKDDCSEVRLAAAKSLGKIGDKRVLEPLLKALIAEENIWQTEHFAKAIINVDDISSLEQLISLLNKKHINWHEQIAIVQALKYYNNTSIVPMLIKKLKIKDKWVKKAIIETLQALKDERAVIPLIKMLKNKDTIVQKVTIETLTTLKDERAVIPLIKMLSGKKREIKETALIAVFKLLKDETIKRTIKKLDRKQLKSIMNAINELSFYDYSIIGEILESSSKHKSLNQISEKIKRKIKVQQQNDHFNLQSIVKKSESNS